MRKLIILAGVPGTGKSFFAKRTLKEENMYIISSDEVRFQFTHDYRKLLSDMNIVYNKMIEMVNELFEKNDDITVVLDSTFLTDERRNYFLDRIKKVDSVELILLKVHNERLIFARNHQRMRAKWVPEEVLVDMMKKYSLPSDENVSRYTSIRVVYTDE